MKRLASCVAFWIVMGLLSPSGFAEQKPPGSLSDEDKLPVPPQQSAAWTPPAGALPKPLVSAATKLFQQGLADPRGCEYREIELLSSRSEFYDPKYEPLATHGWVLPGARMGSISRSAGTGWFVL